MAAKSLVIVESPTKAKTITKFLGKDFIVRASMGHVRDLPENASEVPAKLKKESWARLGVNVDQNFEPVYVVPKNKKDQVKELQDLLKTSDLLYLATDEDREGESISWHLREVLKPKIPTRRLVFHEITKDAIQNSLEHARDIDEDLVRAQETRRIIDRLFGYEVSPLLWKKMAPGLSAGRVQSVAVRLLVERERARIRFRSAAYWGVKAKLQKPGAEPSFEAELLQIAGKRVATSKDFNPDTGKLDDPNALVLLDQAGAERVVKLLEAGPVSVKSVEQKPFIQRPAAPFVTSSLQMESNSKLRFSAKRTMQVAQQLYENGYITYMRTDSTSLSEEAVRAARSLITAEYGKEYLSPSVRTYETKVKNAQEAHEAIRPAGDKFTSPEVVQASLGQEAFRLYDLIYKRTVACQMADARGTNTTVLVEAGDATLRASGKVIEFAGFLKAYAEESDDENQSDQVRVLPQMAQGDGLKTLKADSLERSTQPPNRFTEGSLIKELEKLGIGRPSTWASIVELVLNRSYAFKKGTALVPTFTAMGVVGLLEQHFANFIDYKYTANLEDDLDAISRGEEQSTVYLKAFYFGDALPGLKDLVQHGEKEIDPRIINGLPLGEWEGKKVEVRIGRYGPFISDGERRASVQDEMPPDELTLDKALEMLETASKEPESLGLHPDLGMPIFLKVGRYGPYVQMGDGRDGAKPKMASLVQGTDLKDVDLVHACKLLALPKTLGTHPETNEPVIAANGRFGPYVQSGSETRSLPANLSPIDVTLEEAMELIRQPKARGRGGMTRQQTSLKDFGINPLNSKGVKLLSGRYGAYITDGEVNATVPRGSDPMTMTPEQAFELLAARAQQILDQGGPEAAKKATKARRATKKAATKTAKKTGKTPVAVPEEVEIEF
ncbi:type I DNA topoisomerase [Bryobacter aggregatus]|uniref:type I DNA topoisomerase n=1 Tax=Bryobacter aggregatus TaxID=360054 RepID=UPI0004E27210|nr:type I DNA topoisomerase [Bryobacter aggregatus]